MTHLSQSLVRRNECHSAVPSHELLLGLCNDYRKRSQCLCSVNCHFQSDFIPLFHGLAQVDFERNQVAVNMLQATKIQALPTYSVLETCLTGSFTLS